MQAPDMLHGISEAGPDRKNLLGTDGVIALFQEFAADAEVQEVAQTIVDRANEFSHRVFRDDVCVFVARRTLT